MTPNLAANLSTMFCEWPLLERFDKAAAVGFEVAELQFPYDIPAAEVWRAARTAGIEIALINAPAGDLSQGERGLALERSRRFEHSVAVALDYANTIYCRRVHVLIGKHEGLRGRDLHLAATRLHATAAEFARHGIVLLLEALNPADQPGYCLPTLEHAEALRLACGAANVRLLFDAYHVERCGGDPLRELPRFLGSVGHVQISHVEARGEPEPGKVRSLMRLLESSGYRGYVGCEYNPRGSTLDGLHWARDFGIGPRAAA
jgi:hydroxypyruvate isomerase